MTQNVFIKKVDGKIVSKILSYESTLVGFERVPTQDDLDNLSGDDLTNAMALITEIDAYDSKTGEYSPENTMTYPQKRQQPISKGGYGTWQEQLEILNEQGLTAWKAHCAEVKTRFPK